MATAFQSNYVLIPAALPWSRACERTVNFTLAALLLLLLSPLLALVALLVRCDSRGPILYRQARVGRAGRSFLMLKFRSMRPGAEDTCGPVWAAEADARATRIGAWLRRTHLDELPQLVNVLCGDMNLIGPRPERPIFVQQLRALFPGYDQRHAVRPGITGWAQVRNGYAASTAAAREKLALDLFYLQHRSLWLDLRIALQTAQIVLLARDGR